jgi:spore germination cell wall hydrolase CwlJ-like protein
MLVKSTLKLAFVILLSLITILWVNTETRKRNDVLNAQLIAEEMSILAKKALKPIKQVKLDQLKCLAANIYFEAGSEPFMGQVAVARVVMNRIYHGFAKSPCDVVYQSHTVPDREDPENTKKMCQFSWTCENKLIPSTANAMYKQAEDIARKVLTENMWSEDIPRNVLFFHNNSVNPGWKYYKLMTIGNHDFYGKSERE